MSKLASDLEGIIAKLQDVQREQGELEAQIEVWKARAEKAELLLEGVDYLSTVAKITEAAVNARMTAREWVIQQILLATQPKTELPIDPELYREIAELAQGRSLSVREFCNTPEFSSVLKEAIDNRQI